MIEVKTSRCAMLPHTAFISLSLSLSLSAAVRENEWTVRERETESMTELMKDGI